MMSPCGENFNSSMPSGSGIGSLDWESCGDLIFPNITSDLNEPEEPIDDVDELLPDLITEDELEDINFSEMGLTDGKFKFVFFLTYKLHNSDNGVS